MSSNVFSCPNGEYLSTSLFILGLFRAAPWLFFTHIVFRPPAAGESGERCAHQQRNQLRRAGAVRLWPAIQCKPPASGLACKPCTQLIALVVHMCRLIALCKVWLDLVHPLGNGRPTCHVSPKCAQTCCQLNLLRPFSQRARFMHRHCPKQEPKRYLFGLRDHTIQTLSEYLLCAFCAQKLTNQPKIKLKSHQQNFATNRVLSF